MIEPHGQEVRYVPRQEARPGEGPSIWLVLLAGLVVPGLIAYVLATSEIAFAIAVFGALLVGAAIMAEPFIGLVVFLILLYCRPEELFPAITGMRLTLIVTAFTLFSAWVQMFLRKERLPRVPVIGFMVGIAVLGPLSAVVKGGDNLEKAVRLTPMLLLLMLMLLVLVRNRQRFQALITAMIGVTTYLAAYSLYLLYTADVAFIQKQGVAQGESNARVLTEGSIFQDPNDLASALVPGIGLVLLRILQARGWRKAPYIAVAPFLLFTMYQTQSRGGMIALILMLFAFIVLNMKKKSTAIAVAIVMGLGVFAAAGSRMRDIDAQDDSAQSRFQFWDNGLQALKDSPIIGVGFSNYEELNFHHQAPHNTYLQILVELGPLGLFCFLGMFYYAFRRPTQAARDELPTDADRRDLLGTRIALGGFMIAVFFLSRAYIPCTYIQAALPMLQQVTASGRDDVLSVTPKERMKDWGLITLACIGLVVTVKIILWKFL